MKPKTRTWDLWAIVVDGDLQMIFQPGERKKDIQTMLRGKEQLVKVRVTVL